MISTPAIKGTILPGITRKSILDVAVSEGYQVLFPLLFELGIFTYPILVIAYLGIVIPNKIVCLVKE